MSIKKFIFDVSSDFITQCYQAMIDYILNSINLHTFFDFGIYLQYVQAIAGGLLIVKIIWESIKNKTGFLSSEDASIGNMVVRIIAAGALIYFLPLSVEIIFLRINNLLIKAIQYRGVRIDYNNIDLFLHDGINFQSLTYTFLFLQLVLSIAFVILLFVACYRVIELIIDICFAPLAAISVIGKGEGLIVWCLETTAIVFTQSVHVFLLQILLTIVGRSSGFVSVIFSIVIIAIMIKGPAILRKYLYSSGVGGATVSTIGQGGKMLAMKAITKGLI